MGNAPVPFIRLGYFLAGAAFLVQGPRLILTTLAAHRLPVTPDTEQLLLSVAAVATAVILTGGGIYIAHAALSALRWRLALGIAWVLVLSASAGLVAPAIAGGLANQELHEVIGSPGLRQAWALLAALAHELTAAGCILAAVASSRPRPARGLALPASR
jgi:Kef-type K+ transport system membrane component KefB